MLSANEKDSVKQLWQITKLFSADFYVYGNDKLEYYAFASILPFIVLLLYLYSPCVTMSAVRYITLLTLVAVGVVLSQTVSDWSSINPCNTWWPLGSLSQPRDTLPYTAICSPSEDGSLVFSKFF